MREFNIKIFSDGANVKEIVSMDHDDTVDGF